MVAMSVRKGTETSTKKRKRRGEARGRKDKKSSGERLRKTRGRKCSARPCASRKSRSSPQG